MYIDLNINKNLSGNMTCLFLFFVAIQILIQIILSVNSDRYRILSIEHFYNRIDI